MTRRQIIEEIKQLSVTERIALIEAITRSLREDLETGQSAASISAASNTETADDGERERKIAAVRRLRGVAKSEGEQPSDEELKEDYVNYLSEKYS
jgi:archaellum biogenesis ATPase FlaH